MSGFSFMKDSKKLMLFALIITISLIAFFVWRYVNSSSEKLVLTQSTFKALPNWAQDDPSQALLAFQKSCAEILKRDPDSAFSNLPQGGQVSDWQAICKAAVNLTHPDKLAAQQFFEHWFQPFKVKNNFTSRGLFTGYYLPLLHGSLKKDKRYSVPIYSLPKDLISVDLSPFRSEFSKKAIVGRLEKNVLIPYPDRSAIENGAINKYSKVLVWSDDVIDVFFAQIQGSAIIELPQHQQILMGYAGTNGRPYTAIGRVLIDNKFLPKEKISMQSIRSWLLQHPEQINTILNQNASYVFFHILKGNDPLGTEHVPLTKERTLAVDTRYIPLGAPVWIDTSVQRNAESAAISYRRLMVAQDTGGAIKGIIRSDIYWGTGDEAAYIAGTMKNTGRYWILLPKVR